MGADPPAHDLSRDRSISSGLGYREQISQCFEGLEMVDPGLVPITQWWPDITEVGDVEPIDAYGAVARKP